MLFNNGTTKVIKSYSFFFRFTADGYCRSEGVVVLLLEKSKMALKSYLTVVDAMDGSDGYKQQGRNILLAVYV